MMESLFPLILIIIAGIAVLFGIKLFGFAKVPLWIIAFALMLVFLSLLADIFSISRTIQTLLDEIPILKYILKYNKLENMLYTQKNLLMYELLDMINMFIIGGILSELIYAVYFRNVFVQLCCNVVLAVISLIILNAMLTQFFEPIARVVFRPDELDRNIIDMSTQLGVQTMAQVLCFWMFLILSILLAIITRGAFKAISPTIVISAFIKTMGVFSIIVIIEYYSDQSVLSCAALSGSNSWEVDSK